MAKWHAPCLTLSRNPREEQKCRNKWERRRFVIVNGYRFSPAELVCVTSPGGAVSEDRTAMIERVRSQHGRSAYAFM